MFLERERDLSEEVCGTKRICRIELNGVKEDSS